MSSRYSAGTSLGSSAVSGRALEDAGYGSEWAAEAAGAYQDHAENYRRRDVLRLPQDLVTEIPVISPPGYSGHTPGVYAGNVFGHTSTLANLHGIMHAHRQRELQGVPTTPRRLREVTPLRSLSRGPVAVLEDRTSHARLHSLRPEMPPRPHSVGGHYYPEGAKVPGYSGFVPGVISGSLIGVATPRAARAHWHPEVGKTTPYIGGSHVDPSRMPSAGRGPAYYSHSSAWQD